MADFIKRIQTRVNAEIRKINKELGVSKNQVRGTFEQLGINADSPTEEELKMVFDAIVGQFTATNTISSGEAALAVATPEPQEVVHTSEDVQPSEPHEEEIAPIAHDQQEPEDDGFDIIALNGITGDCLTTEDAWEEEEEGQQEEAANNSIIAVAPNLPSQSHETNNIIPAANNLPSGGLIPQGEVANMVNQAFAGQPPQIQEQITEYAMQHTFENVSQVQAFLEQLRGMEFKLLVDTLNDHFQRRGSMLTVLNEVLTGQKAKDSEASQAFFASFSNRLAAFQQEMESKLSKQGL